MELMPMGGFDEHVAVMGDWMPPSPSPRAFFTTMMGDDLGLRLSSEPTSENKNEAHFLGLKEQTDEKDKAHEQKVGPRGGLLERMAARAGFNAPRLNTESIRPADLSQNHVIRSPCLTIPPGLSPTTLLDSPVFLSNSMSQPSPTTGKFSLASGGNGKSSMFIRDGPAKSKENFFDSFVFKPNAESSPSFFLGAQSFPSIEVSVQSETSRLPQSGEPDKVQSQKDNGCNNNSAKHSPPLVEQQEEDQIVGGDNNVGSTASEDGYNWRKYGQKQVKGSEYPRSYYKCTHSNCPVKKKVERSHEGHITEIIYKGAHNHPKPPHNRRSAIGSSNAISDMQLDVTEQAGTGVDRDPVWTGMQKGTAELGHDNYEVTSSGQLGPETSLRVQNGAQFELGDAVDRSSTFSNGEEDDDRGTHRSGSLGIEGEEDESESKRRKVEAYAADVSGATRAIREPRVVVQTTSEVDILDDGYRWRKYGQKVVKGNPNPRSYYKCTSAGCQVRKHVERASHDLKSVITTYEGKHNHDVPAARNNSHGVNNMMSSHSAVPTQAHRPEPLQVHNNMARFERPHSLGSFGQFGGSNGFSFGMNQPMLANLAMAGFGPNQRTMPSSMGIHPYLGQPRPMQEMGFMLPKAEPKVEHMSEPSLNLTNDGSSSYPQIMNRLPLGP